MIETNNPMLLNVTYFPPPRKGGADDEERFEVIYKDENGSVHKIDEAPEATIWFVKPEYRNFNYNKPQERMERMYPVRTKISKIRYAIAEQMGEEGKNFIKQCYEQKDFKQLNQLYKWRYSFAADFQPEYYYMKDWYDIYKLPENIKLSKAFLDIETDLMDYSINMDDIPNTAYAPVNCVTVIFSEGNNAYTFCLRPYKPNKFGMSDEDYKQRYELYQKQLADHEKLFKEKQAFINDLHDRFDGTYGSIDYHLQEYEQEIDLIADLFRVINKYKPNFCEIWNMRFDIQYLYYRIIALGYDPASVMCHPDFKNKKCYFKLDRSTFEISKQYDYFYCSSYTQYICQMRMYASVRKSQHTLRSLKLNDIGDAELRDKKVEYPENANIVRFPYVDWILFIIYNIKDVLLQVGIERKTNDAMVYYIRSHANHTPYNKIFKETHLLRNIREMYFEKEGWVQGNNINILSSNDDSNGFYGLPDQEEEKSSFKGAIMGNPLMNDYVGMIVLGRRTNNLFENSMDYDMGAFYPSIKIASNMDPGTLLFKAAFNNDEFINGEFYNRSLDTTYYEKDKNGKTRKLDITGEAVNMYAGENYLTLGYNYLHLPSVTEMANMIIKELS